jgi:gluconolactonase
MTQAASAARAVLERERASVFFDGIFSSPRLQHPEGIAIGPDGAVWCGSENGQILRIARDASHIEEIASTGGFVLGIAFDDAGHLFACDLRHACVFRLDLASRQLHRLAAPGMRIPNYPVVDHRRRCLYVSDSHAFGAPGPGIWRFDLATGAAELWCDQPFTFANGMALEHDGAALLVAETFAHRICRVPIAPDGRAAPREDWASDLPGLPDGLALDDAGRVYVACYEPSRILRIGTDRRVDIYIEDETAHLLCHPTNIAFDGGDLYVANLGRWHVTRIASDTFARRL